MFALGAYLNNPDGSNPAAEAIFEQNYQGFVSAMGVNPTLINAYVDYTQPIVSWPANASWQAWSNAQSPVARSMIPVVAFPMASIAGGSMPADQQYQAFSAGDYDSEIVGVLQAWTAQGFKTLIMRVGWEMNLQGPTYAGDTRQDEADWVAAFRHIYKVLHQAAQASGAIVQVVWNPSVSNYTDPKATTSLWPGIGSVDIVGADFYAGMYPYSDSSGSPTYHDWVTGLEDTSIAQFMARAGNRSHYWSYPAATKWSLDGSGGHSQSLDSLLIFAREKNKPFAICETGAGNSDAGTDVADDPTFPQWLAATLTKAANQGSKISFVTIWDVNADGNYQYSVAADGKPNEEAAWAKYISPLVEGDE